MGRKKNDYLNNIECLDDDNNDVCGFSDSTSAELKGKCISSFSFTDTNSDNNFCDNADSEQQEDEKNEERAQSIHDMQIKIDSNAIFDNRRTPVANGAAPAIDGELPSIRRCYILRKSTIRKINELKILDADINVCVSTIVDLAIDYYHKLITETKKQ